MRVADMWLLKICLIFLAGVLGILRKYGNKNAKCPISCCLQERNAV